MTSRSDHHDFNAQNQGVCRLGSHHERFPAHWLVQLLSHPSVRSALGVSSLCMQHTNRPGTCIISFAGLFPTNREILVKYEAHLAEHADARGLPHTHTISNIAFFTNRRRKSGRLRVPGHWQPIRALSRPLTGCRVPPAVLQQHSSNEHHWSFSWCCIADQVVVRFSLSMASTAWLCMIV